PLPREGGGELWLHYTRIAENQCAAYRLRIQGCQCRTIGMQLCGIVGELGIVRLPAFVIEDPDRIVEFHESIYAPDAAVGQYKLDLVARAVILVRIKEPLQCGCS